jgi:endothelin-converting enzyme/putative endopeptidase
VLCAAALVLSAYAQNVAKNNAANPEAATHGVALANIDRSVTPGDDFFHYANGAWLKRTEIPPDRAGVDVFTQLEDISNKRTADLIAEIANSNPAAGSETRKVADLYNSYMDEAEIEKRGLDPLKPHLEAIAAIGDKKTLAYALGQSLRVDVDPLNNINFHTSNLFGLWVAPGFHDAEHYTPYLLQGGLILPDREYYISDSESMRKLRTKYQAHAAAMLKLAGFTDPEARAKRVIELETAIAKVHRSLDDNQDIHKSDNPWKRSDFAAKAPGLDWTEYFRGAGLSHVENYMVWQPDAFAGEAKLIESAPLETWKDWMAFHLIDNFGSVLPKPFADEQFAFFGKQMSGTEQQLPRWRRGVYVVDAALGDVVGKIYAERYFPPQAKATGEAMVANLIAAFRRRIEALTWMDPSTKAEAEAKLSSLYVGIGYPETWHDYSNFEVKPDDIFGNFWRGSIAHYQREVARLGNPVDRKEWSMTPQTVNAVNLPLQNALNFPAAILQPPFYDPQAPAAVNYGAIGAVIGHEISHTFDTEGSTFDSKGQLRNWWTPEDLKHFEATTAQLAAQYDTYKPFPDLAVNGKQTLAENIADLGGIAAAFDGYHASLQGKDAPMEDGFTGDQQFFLAFGQNWGEKIREAAERQQVMTDSHSPGEYRASTVRNSDAWYAAFDVKPGEKLYLAPAERVRIW